MKMFFVLVLFLIIVCFGVYSLVDGDKYLPITSILMAGAAGYSIGFHDGLVERN